MPEKKTARWRLRYSLRALFAVTSIVAVWFGLHQFTERLGIPHVKQYLVRDEGWIAEDDEFFVKAPLVIESRQFLAAGQGLNMFTGGVVRTSRYYVWLFGYVIELESFAGPTRAN